MKKIIFAITVVCIFSIILMPNIYAGVHGDLDRNGKITSEDARCILRLSIGAEETQKDDILYGDFDNDGRITSNDARLVLRKSVNLFVHKMHKFEKKEIILPNGKKEIHNVCKICGRDRDNVPDFEENTVVVINHIFESYGARGCEVAAVEGREVTHAHAYGYADFFGDRMVNTDTKYRVASTSKLITCITFMALCDEKIMDDQADISEYFGYLCRNPWFPDDVITPSMIMSHTSSINGNYSNGGTFCLADKALNLNTDSYLKFKPGSEYEYCNAGLSILSCAMERVTGKSLNQLAHEYIFDKMGIDASFVASELSNQSNLGALPGLSVKTLLNVVPRGGLGRSLNIAQGNLLISAKDYCRILGMMLNNGVAEDGTVILSPESVEKMEKIRIYEDYSEAPGHYGAGYGLQIEDNIIGDKKFIMHIGSAYGMFCTYLYSREDDCGMYVMTSGCEEGIDPYCEVYNVCLDVIRAVYPTLSSK